jgi:peroxiredoxin
MTMTGQKLGCWLIAALATGSVYAADASNPFVDDDVQPAGFSTAIPPKPHEVRAAFAASFAELRESGILDRALGVGDRAPDFELPSANGINIRLSELRAVAPVVLVYYRGNWCPFCTRQLQGLQQALTNIHSEDAQLVAISPETATHGLDTQRQNQLGYPTLTDQGNAVAREFGLTYPVSADAAAQYAPFVDLAAHNGDASRELPLAATYVIDSAGIIRYAFVSVDFTERAEPAEILRVLRRLKESTPRSPLTQPLARR